MLHARKEKTELSPRQNGREVQVGLVTQLVVELNLLETGRNTLSRSLKRERVFTSGLKKIQFHHKLGHQPYLHLPSVFVSVTIRFIPYVRAATTFLSVWSSEL